MLVGALCGRTDGDLRFLRLAAHLPRQLGKVAREFGYAHVGFAIATPRGGVR
jgi:hypothetical protein